MASSILLPRVTFPSLGPPGKGLSPFDSPGTPSSGEDSGETLVNPVREGSDSDWALSSDPFIPLKGHTGVQPALKSKRPRSGRKPQASISRPRKKRQRKKKVAPQEPINQDMDITLEFDEDLPAWVTEPPPPEWTLPYRPRRDSTGRELPSSDSAGESSSDEDDEIDGAPDNLGMDASDRDARDFWQLVRERRQLDFLYLNPLSPRWFPAEDMRNSAVAQKSNRGW